MSQFTHANVWMLRIGTALWVLLGLGFLLSAPIILDLGGVLLFYTLLFSILVALPIALLFKRKHQEKGFLGTLVPVSIALYFVACTVLAAPIYYLATIAETNPVIYPQATFTNGKKTVVFQGMQHVGSENFYKAVIYDIEKSLADGYHIYYEGVQTKTPESKAYFARFTTAVTGQAGGLEKTYELLGKACGLKFQEGYFELLDADKKEHPERHVVADVDALDIKREYERLLRDDPEFAKLHPNGLDVPAMDALEGTAGLVEWLESGTGDRIKLAGVICRGVMAINMGKESTSGTFNKFEPVILDYRNRMLVKQIIEETHHKIFITYGAKHLPGVFELLKEHDPNWELASVKWMRVVEAPKKDFKRELTL